MRSALDVWLDKTGRAADDPGNDFTQHGHRMEQIIAEEFAEKHAVKLRRCTTVAHSEIPHILATPDRRLVGSREGLECKNVGWRMLHKWRVGDGWTAPTNVLLQVQWQCIVTGWDGVHVAARIGGRDWHEQYVEADSEIGEMLIEAANDFWRLVERDIQPDPGPSDAARKILERIYPGASQPIEKAPPEVEKMVRGYVEAARAEKAAKAAKNDAANALRQAIGERAGYNGEWGEVTWIARGKGRTAWAKVAAEMQASAEVIAKHSAPPKRSLRVFVHGEDNDDGNDE